MPKSKEPAYGTSRGVPVTEDLIEVAREAERGYDVDSLRRRGGRPPLGAKPSEVVPVRLDPDLHRALEDRAKEETTSASEVIRRALRAYLDAPKPPEHLHPSHPFGTIEGTTGPPSSRAWDVQIPHPSRQGIHPTARQIAPLRRFWALCEERIILASALIRHLQKHTNAQRLVLSNCKAGALPTELRPRVLMSINVSQQTRKNTYVTPILSPETAQRL